MNTQQIQQINSFLPPCNRMLIMYLNLETYKVYDIRQQKITVPFLGTIFQPGYNFVLASNAILHRLTT